MQWQILDDSIFTHRFLPKPATADEQAGKSFLIHGPLALHCQGQTILPAGREQEREAVGDPQTPLISRASASAPLHLCSHARTGFSQRKR